MYTEADQIKHTVDAAQKIVIVQADNPDADSLGSALALEHILGDLGKETYLYCAVDMPGYLKYLPGWDRVQFELPRQFDASIIVDASSMTLFEKLAQSGQQGWLSSKPCVVLDHHETVENIVPFASVIINDYKKSSAGEVIYNLARQLEWPVSKAAAEMMTSSILGDTQGLSNQLASADTYRVVAEFIELGVNRPELEEKRREFSKMPLEIYKYKADLIKRSEFAAEGQVAHVTIPQNEINTFSPLYNPGPLIQGDMLQTTGVRVAIVFKHYADGKVTAAIRCNSDTPVGGELAEHMGGGGHAFASGFKVVGSKSLDTIKTDCLDYAGQLLDKLEA